MSKNILLISLATITLAATTLTNVASSRADTISVAGSGNSSSTAKLTVAPPPKNTPNTEDRVCAAVYPAPPGCSSSSTPSPHTIPYPSYPSPSGFGYIPEYQRPPMSETPADIQVTGH